MENVGSGFPILLRWKRKKIGRAVCRRGQRRQDLHPAQFMRDVEAGKLTETQQTRIDDSVRSLGSRSSI
jgi:hypothetical protein